MWGRKKEGKRNVARILFLLSSLEFRNSVNMPTKRKHVWGQQSVELSRKHKEIQSPM